MRTSDRKPPLKPWAQKTKNAFINGIVGLVLVSAFSGTYLAFINARSAVPYFLQTEAPGGLPSLPPATILFIAVLAWMAWIFISRHKFWPVVWGLETIGLASLNLLWTGILVDVVTFALLVSFILTYVFRGQIDRWYRQYPERLGLENRSS